MKLLEWGLSRASRCISSAAPIPIPVQPLDIRHWCSLRKAAIRRLYLCYSMRWQLSTATPQEIAMVRHSRGRACQEMYRSYGCSFRGKQT